MTFSNSSEGYIRAWAIESYCMHNSGFCGRNRMRPRAGIAPKINITEDVVLSDKRNRQINNIPPDQLFQFHAHVSPITVLAFCDSMQVLFSSSTDGTVRAWAMSGKYIGTFGQKRLWNLKQILDDPRPPASTHRLPPDIKRVASYETLRLFNHGINSWKLAKNIMNILTIKNRIANLKNAFMKPKPVEEAEVPEEPKVEEKPEEKKSQLTTNSSSSKTTLSKVSTAKLGVNEPAGSRRKSFMGTARNVIQINALTKPDESIEEKYEACLERLCQSKYMATYEPRNLDTNVRYEKMKLKVDLRRVLNSLPVAPLTESPVLEMPKVLREACQDGVPNSTQISQTFYTIFFCIKVLLLDIFLQHNHLCCFFSFLYHFVQKS